MLKVGSTTAGFKLLEEKKIHELNAVSRLFQHEKSGARLFHIENDDDNKVFCISFRTPPEDHTGLPHILEHSVLCGSRKYPIKDPFIELAKGSLNTFLNAMTYSDKTMYPVASRNNQDFKNLVDVYLDAVFYPNIYKHHEILAQEGWHYDLESTDQDITYKGVVYNEMKGAFSSPEQILFRNIQQTLFPDTPYGFESGGDPEFIPDLTQEQFENFHKRYYHPCNSYMYLYGDLNIEEYLRYLDEAYLSEFDTIDMDSRIPMQKPFDEPQYETIEYSVAAEESLEDKTYLSYNLVIGEGDKPETHYVMDVLEHILLETPGAPLKKALIEAGIGKDVFGSADTGILQPAFSIVAKGANPEDQDKFIKVIKETLKDLVEKGIDKKEIQAAINIFEFKLREADYGRYPKGLMYGIIAMSTWLYDLDPTLLLNYNPVFDHLKEALTTDYLEQFIKEHILDNNHVSVLMVKPKKGLNSEIEKDTREKLKAYKESLTEEDLEELVRKTKHLKEYQEEPSTKEDLEKVPLLELEDISRQAENFELHKEELEGSTLLVHESFTNEVGYVNMYFDLENVDEKHLPYANLLANVLGKLDTTKRGYGDLSNDVNIYTGGINFRTSVYNQNNAPMEYSAKFVAQGKSFYTDQDKMFELIEEILKETDFSSKARLKEVLVEMRSRLQMNMVSSGHEIASMHAQSYFSPGIACKDQLKGIGYYNFLTELEKDFDSQFDCIKEALEETLKCILTKANLTIGYTAEAKNMDKAKDLLRGFVGGLEDSYGMKATRPFTREAKNEGFMTSDKIQYVAKAGNYIDKGFNYTGTIPVLKTILSLEYLWGRVRVMGGAYGCMTGFTRSGNMYFVSYRDPNLKETLKAYNEAYAFVKDFDCDEREMVKYIIGTMSRIDAPLSPSMKGSASVDYYFMGITQNDIQETREQILDTRPVEIRGLADMLKTTMEEEYLCVQGNEDKIREDKDVFHSIKQLFN